MKTRCPTNHYFLSFVHQPDGIWSNNTDLHKHIESQALQKVAKYTKSLKFVICHKLLEKKKQLASKLDLHDIVYHCNSQVYLAVGRLERGKLNQQARSN